MQRDYIPNVDFGGTRLASSPSFGTSDAPFINYNTTIDITDSVSKVWNRHTIKAGIYMQRSRKDQTSFGDFNGNYNFGDNSANPYDTGFGFANAAAGRVQLLHPGREFHQRPVSLLEHRSSTSRTPGR